MEAGGHGAPPLLLPAAAPPPPAPPSAQRVRPTNAGRAEGVPRRDGSAACAAPPRRLGYNNLVIAIIGDVMPYALAHLAADDSWGGSPSGRYLRIKAALLVALLAVCVGTALDALRPKRRAVIPT